MPRAHVVKTNGIPPHIAAGLKEPVQYCDCKAIATVIGWFKSITGGNYDIRNGVFLCDACAQALVAIDPDVTLGPLRERERELQAWETLP